jgi:hypothetical protein
MAQVDKTHSVIVQTVTRNAIRFEELEAAHILAKAAGVEMIPGASYELSIGGITGDVLLEIIKTTIEEKP